MDIPDTNPAANTQQTGESKGSMVGSIIVLIILILGALYVFSMRSKTPENIKPTGTDTTATTSDVQ